MEFITVDTVIEMVELLSGVERTRPARLDAPGQQRQLQPVAVTV